MHGAQSHIEGRFGQGGIAGRGNMVSLCEVYQDDNMQITATDAKRVFRLRDSDLQALARGRETESAPPIEPFHASVPRRRHQGCVQGEARRPL